MRTIHRQIFISTTFSDLTIYNGLSEREARGMAPFASLNG
jgi:hypothetical protein